MGPSTDTEAPSQYQDGLSNYGYFHDKVKTVVKQFYLCNANSYTGKTMSLYWNGLLLFCVQNAVLSYRVTFSFHKIIMRNKQK